MPNISPRKICQIPRWIGHVIMFPCCWLWCSFSRRCLGASWMHALEPLEYIVWEDDGDHIGKTMVKLWGQCRDNIGIICDNSICFWYIYRFWWWRGSVKSAVEYHRITCLVLMGTSSRITPDVLCRRTSYNLNQQRFLILLKWWSDFKQIGIESKRWWSNLQQLASGWFGWFVFIRLKLTLRTSTSCVSPGQGAIWQHFNLPEFPNKPKITQTTCPASLNNDFTSWWFVGPLLKK